MNTIIFYLQRLIYLPYEIVTAPFRSDSALNESPRSRAMMLGLPAVFVGLLGFSMIAWAYFGNASNLEANYNLLAEQANDQKVRLLSELQTEQKLAAARGEVKDEKQFELSNDDPRVERLLKLQEAEKIYLEKLISLNPENPEYMYRLALVAKTQGDDGLCFSLMNLIAPDEEPGYAKAHLWIAHACVNQPVRSAAEARLMRRKALRHADHCLVRESDNLNAKLIKAQLLKANSRWLEALMMYEELFEVDPRFFVDLIELNEKLDQKDQNPIVLDRAQVRLQELVKQTKDGYDEKWPRHWVNLLSCLAQKRDFATAEELLLKEEETQRMLAEKESTPEAASRHVFIKQLLVRNYTEWASSIEGADIAQQRQQLELIKKGMGYGLNDPKALQMVARLTAADSEIAAEAKAIYDPEKQDDAPPAVLNEMGGQALSSGRYNEAIRYFELARRKRPRDAIVLNNLAYAYLVCENKNPDRALNLVNQAIRVLGELPASDQRDDMESSFHDTRGNALMQMNRLDEAAAAFELAMQHRPEEKKILESLIKCYEGRDDRQAEVYRRRLAALNENNSAPEDGPTN